MNQIKLQLNSQIYALIGAEYVSLISIETDQTIIHIPSHTVKRLNDLQHVLMQNPYDGTKTKK